MSSKLSYADAVKLLGGADKGIVSALNKLTGGLLLATTGGGGQFVLSLFDVEGELARLNRELVGRLGDQLRGLGRLDRTERLTAAHRVIVLTGFFEAVSGIELPVTAAGLPLDRSAQVGVSTGEDVSSHRLGVLAGILNGSDVPGESAGPGGGSTPSEIEEFYGGLSGRLLDYMAGLAAWDEVSETARSRFADRLRHQVPTAAQRRYEEYLRRLAGEFPEVAFWANRLEHAATYGQLRRLQTGLEGLGQVLDRVASGGLPDDRRQLLARRYGKMLDKPILATGDVPEGMIIPTLAGAYVNPRYRAAAVSGSAQLDQERWWAEQPARGDLQEFLIGHLTSVTATEAPLIVLGQPGSGKSVLTKVLAARLPARDYLTVRVALREVPADTDLQSQIEYAIRAETGESLTWPALARSADGALPVVLLDGFDELLQATGIGQTDYLEQIARFQEREAELGRPVAVVITSRTAVADRARLPSAGAVAVRLEPFTDEQVRLWLSIWNASNAAYLAGRNLLTLPAEAVLRQRALAAQPLLLLMLALYDADDNALQRHEEGLAEAELYERLLTRFAEREIRKLARGIDAEGRQAAIEHELLRLSVAAFAMFNRGRQWVTEPELSKDLIDLLGADPGQSGTGFQDRLSPAQLVVGRFFFIHQAQAVRDGSRLTTCEFLHATFGEFLSARLILRELTDLAAVAATRSRQATDDGFLRALMSFVPLTIRETIIGFLADLARRLDEPTSRRLRGLLLAAFHGAMGSRTEASFDRYGPDGVGAPARHAAYSANLLLLIALIGGPVTGRELFPDARFPAAEWRRHAMLWRSQFTGDGWANLAAALRLERIWDNHDREIRISFEPWTPPSLDSFWTFKIPPVVEMRRWSGWRDIFVSAIRKESYFTCDTAEDIVWHGIEPIALEMDARFDVLLGKKAVEATSAFGVLAPDRVISVTNAMVKLWVTSSDPHGGEELERAYEDCLTVIERSRPRESTVSRDEYLARVLRQLAADHQRLSPQFRAMMLRRLKETILREDHLNSNPVLRHWAAEAFGELGHSGD
jgi:hypothetical protein